jgi:uncharacterized protein (TIGR02145 family)
MKKVLFWMFSLLLMFFGAANIHGQVTIGSDESPHPDALLELKSDSRGLLLPRVYLRGVDDFLVNGGDKAAAAGMLVFNTSDNLNGPGLYVWTGTVWQTAKSGECDVPAKPATITFSPANITVNVNTLLTVTADFTTTDFYEWTYPAGFEISGNANTRSIQLKAKQQGTFPASGITVKAINACGAGEATAGSGTINVTAPLETPTPPTLTFPKIATYLEPGDPFTITCSDVGANEYIWTLPDGITPIDENITLVGGTYTTTTNLITVTVPEGIYESNTFKVKAKNTETSAENTGSGGRIIAKSCEGAPRDGYIPLFSGEIYAQDATITYNLVIARDGPVTIQWTLPQGLSIVSGNGTMQITFSCDKLGTYNGSDIRVKVKNGCGETTVNSSGTFTVISDKGSKGTLEGINGTYTTYKYPNGLGTWMTQNSKEGSPDMKQNGDHAEGERGYYYTATEASQACPNGWALPTPTQFSALWTYLKTLTSINEQNEGWLSQETLAGYSNKPEYWDQYGGFRTTATGTSVVYYEVSNKRVYGTPSKAETIASSVRCIKSSCDEAPKYVRIVGNRPGVVPVNGRDTVWVSYQTLGPDTTVTWTSSNDIEIITPTKTYAVLRYKTTGTFSWSNLTCTIDNGCSTTTVTGSGEYTAIDGVGSSGTSVTSTSSNNTYQTWDFPGGLGRWTVKYLQNEGTWFSTKDNVSFYRQDQAEVACKSLPGMRLGHTSEMMRMLKFWRSAWYGGLGIPAPPASVKANSSSSFYTAGWFYLIAATPAGSVYWVETGSSTTRISFEGPDYTGSAYYPVLCVASD